MPIKKPQAPHYQFLIQNQILKTHLNNVDY